MIIDLHADTIGELLVRKDNAQGPYEMDLIHNDLHVNLEKLRQGGAFVQVFALYCPTDDMVQYYQKKLPPDEYFRYACKYFKEQLELASGSIRQVIHFSDISKNQKEGKISALMSMEGAAPADSLEHLQEFYDLGLRMLSFTWNYETRQAFPNSNDPGTHTRGLKAFGFECLAEMNRLGMIMDVSHLSEGGFWDIAMAAKAPFVASHSCARALSDHSRNLSDDMLRELGNKGGVCGVNFYSEFLRLQSNLSTVDDIVRHILHIKNHAGADAIALGSDFDGIKCGLEISSYDKLPGLIEAASAFLTQDELDKLCYKNALRVMKEVLK
jgi:membrane dipeptidase